MAPNFRWTDEHDLAFAELKRYLEKLPTLSVPTSGEVLSLYLAALEEAVNAVLVREEGRRQLPVYFISMSLKGSEMRYQPLEKLALALVNASRRLKRYFYTHTIRVLTDHPLRHVLTKPEASGRIAKWAIELGEYDIEYSPRQSIKGQALADFLVETALPLTEPPTRNSTSEVQRSPPRPNPESPTDRWDVYVDGALGKKGSGAESLFISPDKCEIKHSLRFAFPTTNNEAEYESQLAGLRIAKELSIQAVRVHSDSQVIVSHMLGTYEAREDRMQRYLDKAKQLQQGFLHFEIIRIPRQQNARANALSKLASASATSPVEEIRVRSIDNTEVNRVIDTDMTWMMPIRANLEKGELPADKAEARRILSKSLCYTFQQGILYKKSYLQPLLRCIGPMEADYVMRKVHEGSCGSHIGSRALARKIMKWGYYWPTLLHGCTELVKACAKCQIHSNVQRLSQSELASM